MLHMHEWMFLCAQTPYGYLVLYLEVYYMNVNVVQGDFKELNPDVWQTIHVPTRSGLVELTSYNFKGYFDCELCIIGKE